MVESDATNHVTWAISTSLLLLTPRAFLTLYYGRMVKLAVIQALHKVKNWFYKLKKARL